MNTPEQRSEEYLNLLTALATLGKPLCTVPAGVDVPGEIHSALVALEIGLLKVEAAILTERIKAGGS